MSKSTNTAHLTFTDGAPEQSIEKFDDVNDDNGLMSFAWFDDKGRIRETISFPIHRISSLATTTEYED